LTCQNQSCCAPAIFTTITPPTPTPAAISLSIITDVSTGYPTLTWDIEDADIWRDSILIQSNTASPYTDTSAVSGQSYEYQTKSGIDSSNVVKAQIPGLSDTQSAPLPVGFQFPHALLYFNGNVFAVARMAPGVFTWIDQDDVSDQDVRTFAADGFHDYPLSLIAIPSKGKLYTFFSNLGASPTPKVLTVTEIDPYTFVHTDVIRDDTSIVGNGSMDCDGTYLYLLSYGAVDSTIIKYQISDWSKVSTTTLTGLPFGHALRWDGSNLYATGQGSTPWVAKIDVSDMSYESANFPTPLQSPTDDFGLSDDHFWVGFESAEGLLVKVSKSDLSMETIDTTLVTGIPQACYGVQEAGVYMYALMTSGADLYQITISGNNQAAYRFTGFPSINEIQTNGTYLYVTQYTSTPTIMRLRIGP